MSRFDRRAVALSTVVSLIVGNTLLAFLVAAFIIPNGIIMGGTTGIGIVLQGIAPTLDVATVVLVLNIALLLFGRVVLGRKFFYTTVVSSVLYPLELGAFQRIPGIDSLTDDPVLAAIFAGCLLGVALGLVMRVGSSTGGTDVICLVLHRWLHVPIATLVNVTDFIIMGGQALFCDSEQIMLGLLVLVLETITLDKTILLGKAQIQLFVISKEYERIREALLTELEAGVTMIVAESGRLRREGMGVLCVIPQRKLYDATELICQIDPAAFTTVARINEVRGRGFTSERIPLSEEGVEVAPDKAGVGKRG